ncbi:MAG: FKBP-type peptidyl-prolyl cis-trans isomerase [Candidatus Hodarchaeales archaeon]|jgi:FKBP-type peptidyl-prolyl cis-trans isomerase 2
MPIAENDWIKIDYTGRLKENNKVFDTTLEDIARSEHIYDEKRGYSPLLCRAGDEKFLIPGLARKLVGIELNSPQTFEIPIADAYGARDSSKIEMVPTKRLRKANLDPRVGARIQFQGRSGTIIWKDLVFDVTVVGHLEDETEIQKEIISRRLPGVDFSQVEVDVSEDKETISISLPNYLIFMEGLPIAKYSLATELRDFLDFKIVEFIDRFDYREKDPEEVTEGETQDTDSSSDEEE